MEIRLQQFVGKSYWSRRRAVQSNVLKFIESKGVPYHCNLMNQSAEIRISRSVVRPVEALNGRDSLLSNHVGSHFFSGVPVTNCSTQSVPSWHHEDDYSFDGDIEYLTSSESSEDETSDEEMLQDDDLQNKIHVWSLNHGITMSALRDLLHIMKVYHPTLP